MLYYSYLCMINPPAMRIKRILSLFLAGLLLIPAGCIDKDYNLDGLKIEGHLFTNLEVPVGNFEEMLLEDLGIDPSIALPDASGRIVIATQADITGLDFNFEEDLSFEEAELHTVLENTIPLDFSLAIVPIDAEGNPIPDISISLEADQDPAVKAGAVGSPSKNPLTIRLTCNGTLVMDGLRFVLDGRTGKGHEGERLSNEQGIRLTDVYLRIPKGFKYATEI